MPSLTRQEAAAWSRSGLCRLDVWFVPLTLVKRAHAPNSSIVVRLSCAFIARILRSRSSSASSAPSPSLINTPTPFISSQKTTGTTTTIVRGHLYTSCLYGTLRTCTLTLQQQPPTPLQPLAYPCQLSQAVCGDSSLFTCDN
jgi:hypothetical protein